MSRGLIYYNQLSFLFYKIPQLGHYFSNFSIGQISFSFTLIGAEIPKVLPKLCCVNTFSVTPGPKIFPFSDKMTLSRHNVHYDNKKRARQGYIKIKAVMFAIVFD